MAHRGPAKIPGADDRPGGRKPGGFTPDPGLSFSSKQFGGQVGAALASEGQQSFAITAKFAAAERAAAVSSAKADFDAEATRFENELTTGPRTDYAMFVPDHEGALKTAANKISSGLRGEVKAAFEGYVRSQSPLSTARVRKFSRTKMISVADAKSLVTGDAAVGKALSVETPGEVIDVRKAYFDDLDQLALYKIKTPLEVAKLKRKFDDDVAKGQLSKIILDNPFDPQAELAIKNLRPALQAKASEQLKIARNSRVTADNRDASRKEKEEDNAIKFNNTEIRRLMVMGMQKFDQNNDKSRAEGLAWAEAFELRAIINARNWGLDAKSLDWLSDEIDDFREGKISPPGGLNAALAGITDETVTNMDHPLVKVLSNEHKSLVQSRFDRLKAEGQKHFTKQDAFKAGLNQIEALILSANPLVIAGADNAVLRNQIANKIKLAQSLYRARAYDANDRGEMLRDLSNVKEGKYSVFNEVRDIVALAATPSSAEAQIKVLIEEKNVILDKIREQMGAPFIRARELAERAASLAGAVAEETGEKAPVTELQDFMKGVKAGKVDPALQSRISFLDQRIFILNSLGTSPEVLPVGLIGSELAPVEKQ
jgi:hypothetical protein